MSKKNDNPEPASETPLLDSLEADQALLHELAEKVSFWSMVAGHLLMRLEATTPETHIAITPKYVNLAMGLAMQYSQTRDEIGPTHRLFIEVDKETMKLIRADETARRKANGIGIEVVIKTGPVERRSGIVGIDGKELPATERRPVSDAREPGTTGEVP